MLSQSQLDAFHSNGFIYPFLALSNPQAQAMLDRLDGIREADVAKVLHPWYYKSYLLFTWLDELVRSPAIVSSVANILGPNVICFSCDIWRKTAGETRHISWHQDASYWAFEPPNIITAWVALSDANRNNGCMRFAPKSHQLGALNHTDTFADNNMLSHGQVVDLCIDETSAVSAELHAGQYSLHHCLLAHASHPNPSTADRVGLCIRYAPGNLTQIKGPPVSAMTVLGQATGNLIEERPPSSDLSAQAVAQHNQLLAPHAATRYTRF